MHKSIRAIAIPAAPLPLTTTFKSSKSLPTTLHAFFKAAETTIAVPCWSSCITGMPTSSRLLSISKHLGAEMSSRLIAPKTGAMLRTMLSISFAFWVLMQMGNASMPASSLNSRAFPSITGMAASAPTFPKPRTAEPSVTTATQFPFMVYSRTKSGFFAISSTGLATPGVYAKPNVSMESSFTFDFTSIFPLSFL